MQLVSGLDHQLMRIQELSEAYGIYSTRLKSTQNLQLAIDREQTINSLQMNERNLKIQLEMAQLRKEEYFQKPN